MSPPVAVDIGGTAIVGTISKSNTSTPPEPSPRLELPTIDLSGFRGADTTPASRTLVVDAIHKAVTTHGFLYLVNHGLPKADIDDLFGIGKGFFADVPDEVRRDPRWAFGSDYAGYRDTSFSIENGKPEDYTRPADPRVEAAFMARRGDKLPASFNGERSHFGYDFLNVPGKWGKGEFDKTRVWPDYIVERQAQVQAFTKKMYELGLDLLRAFALALQIEDEEWFVERHRYDVPSRDSFRWIKYPPVPDSVKRGPDGVVRTAAHSDFGSLTMLIQHGEPGLQLNWGGQWVDIEPRPDENGVPAVLINISDCLQFWTEGYFASTLHRVVSDTPAHQAQTRYVMAYFMRPEHDTRLVGLPSPVVKRWLEEKGFPERTEEEIVTAGEWTDRKLKAVYDVDQKK
ncbi:Clavaminate synthase-like protein [Gonapodya prolifera JEL478]|uniref:Clavaminate synthase-like protein n=1 Tax=Gonapodya prolifera (strain JEL478) TaxID=1344416 RepID=A0A139AKV5_GONPJ|nr:Clavaminate synthase-like protein [Gonapodya prolifera JEL478]|eukprot:KXS17432.1 Clavaminate synthase-like protein [Gonapodya prolifera JEL478]